MIYGDLKPKIFYTFSVFPSLTSYMYFPTSASGYFLTLMYFITPRLGSLNFHGDILTLLASTSISCITLISALTSLTTEIALLLFFEMDRVIRHILSVWLLVPCRPVLLEPFEVLSGVIWCDSMRNELWFRSATAS